MRRRGARTRGGPWLAFLLLVFIQNLPGLNPVRGEGLRDFPDGWLLGPVDVAQILTRGGASSGSSPGGNGAVQEKTGLGVWGAVGQGRLFSMADLPWRWVEGGFAGSIRKLPWSVGVSWERLGSDLLVEEARSLQVRLGANPRAGVRLRSRKWLVAAEPVDQSLETIFEGRVSFRLGGSVTGIVGLHLHPGDLPQWHRSRGRRTVADFRLLGPGSGLACRFDQRGDGTPVVSLEALGRLSTRLGLGFRADPETGSLGGNLTIRLGGFWLQTSHLVHPALGITHRALLGAGDPGASSR